MAELAREIEASLIVGEDKAVADTRRWSRIGYAILAGTFGLSIVWSSLAPLSSAVVAQGSVKVDSSRKKIQHPEGGVVKAILVKDGSTVKAGDVLVRLDETKAGAAYGVVKGGREVALAAQARLEAERDERSSIVFPKVLTRQANEPQIAEILRSQESVFSARRASRLGEVGILERQIGALRSEIAGLQSQQRSKQEQAASVKAELDGLASLASQGMVEKTKIRTIERDLTRLLGERDELASKVASANTAISEKELKKFQVKKAFHEEVVAELKKVQAENFELIERESATRYTLEQTELRAPVDGTVTDLKIHTAGGVIGPGEVVMEVVPSSDRLIVEGKVLPPDIDRVALGQDVGVKLHAFNARTTPELKGKLSYVSADAVLDPRTEMSYFIVKVTVSADELKRLGEQKVQPGMQTDVFIITGERTFLGYLFQPLADSFNQAWRER
ncbi:MAG: HlyD family type I secretion periplasmic adaptor subunit [Zoogloea sp.]|jgi:HlyD family type I secretion membrane fusion protein|nr:HlyD family type I secretion periplasmic adaptor subunit [Zoogloea sp.]